MYNIRISLNEDIPIASLLCWASCIIECTDFEWDQSVHQCNHRPGWDTGPRRAQGTLLNVLWGPVLEKVWESVGTSVCSVAQSCLTLYSPTDCSPAGSSVHGFSRQEHWGASSSRASSCPRDWTRPLCLLHYRQILYLLSHWRRLDVCITKSLGCTPEINTTLLTLVQYKRQNECKERNRLFPSPRKFTHARPASPLPAHWYSVAVG